MGQEFLEQAKVILFKKSVSFVYDYINKCRQFQDFEREQDFIKSTKEFFLNRTRENWNRILYKKRFRTHNDLYNYLEIRNKAQYKNNFESMQRDDDRFKTFTQILYHAQSGADYLMGLLKGEKFDFIKNSNILDRKTQTNFYYRLLGEFFLERLSEYDLFSEECLKIEEILSKCDFFRFKKILEEFILKSVQLADETLRENKNIFTIIENEKKELSQELDKKIEDLKTTVLKDLYKNLNNDETDYLLDKIGIYLQQLNDESKSIPNIELKILLKNLYKAFEKMGFEILGEVGDKITITKEMDTKQYFSLDKIEEGKEYQITKCGWKLNDIILKNVEIKTIN